MCGFGLSRCADVVWQYVVGKVRRNVRVRCDKVCGYAAKCRNGATECGNGATECGNGTMKCGNGATEWQRNGDHARRQIDKIELYLRK